VKSVVIVALEQQGIAGVRENPTKGRKVKSGPADTRSDTADRHERAKDCLSHGEVAKLLNAAKAGRQGVRDHLLLLMTYHTGCGSARRSACAAWRPR
jgi:hypothetical protein